MAWNVVGNIKGPKGDKGDTGNTGPTGPTGPAGATGTSATNYRGNWTTTDTYVLGDIVTRNGAGWIAPAAIAANKDPNPSGDGTTAANGWNIFAAEGAQGPAGAAGAAGTAATVAVGTVNTGVPGSSASVTNGGSSSAAVLNFVIPQGATGATGATGAQGAQGIQGVQGNAGATGATGATGARGSQWFTGTGAPGTITGSLAGDQYLDLSSGDVYTLS